MRGRGQTRREFLTAAALGAAAVAAAQTLRIPYVHARGSTDNKLRVAVIGCGGKGAATHIPVACEERLVAMVDPDPSRFAKAFGKATKAGLKNTSDVRTFTDYRKMFDVMAKEIDAVMVATPNHQHALPALMAMDLGKHVFVEKPMAYSIGEARQLAEWSKRCKVATQMGNQGHSGDGYRRLCEYIWAGAIGHVREVHCWSDRANGGVGGRPRTSTPPAGMDWDSWIGPAPYRDYHVGLHPHEWHGWHDFGDGSLGNMGCHVMDGAHWALKLGHPTSIEVIEQGGGSMERYPTGTKICWEYPARGEMPPVKVYWYDGIKHGIHSDVPRGEDDDGVSETARNRPPIVEELEKKFGRKLGNNGAVYVGDKGFMWSDTYGTSSQIIPAAQMIATPRPAKVIPRIKGTHFDDFFRGCRGGELPCSNFEVAAPLTEMVLLGCLAIKAGLGRKILWDGVGMKCTNMPEVNQFLQREYRKGWRV